METECITTPGLRTKAPNGAAHYFDCFLQGHCHVQSLQQNRSEATVGWFCKTTNGLDDCGRI